VDCLRNYAVLTASPLHHSLFCLSFTVPSTRTSCLDHTGSHLYSYLGNLKIGREELGLGNLVVRINWGVGSLVHRIGREHSTVRIADIVGRVACCVVVA